MKYDQIRYSVIVKLCGCHSFFFVGGGGYCKTEKSFAGFASRDDSDFGLIIFCIHALIKVMFIRQVV